MIHYTFYFGDVWAARWDLVEGTLVTLWLTVLALLLSLVLAIPGAIARQRGPKWLQLIVRGYVEYIRNTPFLIQIFFIFFGLGSAGIRVSPNTAAVIAMAANGTAYTIEIVRAGIVSIGQGQVEAAYSLGLHKIRTFWHIILPQGLKVIFVPLGNQFILLMLTSSVVSVIAASELSAVTHDITSRTFRAFETYLVAAGIYFVLAQFFNGLFRLAYVALFGRRNTA